MITKNKNTIILLSGLVCSGKSTLATVLEKELIKLGRNVERINGDEYIKSNFPKEGFKFDIPTRLKLDQIISKNLIKREPLSTYFIVDLGSITEEGRRFYYSDLVNTILVYVSTPLLVCMFREIIRSIGNKSPIKNWVYLKAIKSKLLGEKDKNLIQGITLPFEEPIKPDFTFDLSRFDMNLANKNLINHLNRSKI